MRNLLNFFFSFDKLFKEKLIIPFFWLSLVVFGLAFFADGLAALRLGPLAKLVGFINWFATLLWALVAIRLVSELAVALFRINDNLSPDGGKSELADIDPVAEARKAAELAAQRARVVAKTAGDKTRSTFNEVKEDVGDAAEAVSSKAKSTAQSVKAKTDATVSKAKAEVSSATKTTAKPASKAAPKKRGRPAGSQNKNSATKAVAKKKTTAVKKTATKKPAAKSTTSGRKKPGPKPGTKALRDADGRLLKKDGTPRKKPGPKPK